MRPRVLADPRGAFIKTYNIVEFAHAPFAVPLSEEYVTTSRRGVLRGMHLQLPPYHLEKVVACIHGAVLDAVLDLRRGSPTYEKHFLQELVGARGDMLYIPPGCAHGFYALTDDAVLLYKVSVVYSEQHDSGVHWASAGIDWPDKAPIVSDRDRQLQPLSEFHSPFEYELQ